MKEFLYFEFLNTLSKDKWQKFGLLKRSGVVIPLFSIYSKNSIGIADFMDLKIACEWTKEVGMSIIQLLPLNDTGFNFRPYDCESGFALEPMYINLKELKGVEILRFLPYIEQLKEKFMISRRVDYRIKKEKLSILWNMFKEIKNTLPPEFYVYQKNNTFWLKDYCLFKVIKERYNQKFWQEWALSLRDRTELENFERENKDRIEFYAWLQWQAYEQLKSIKSYAKDKGIFLMGDLPLLVSRDSADVWAKRMYFKLELSSGAPPDMYYAKGQRWGMPPYNWDNIAKNNYDYIIEKLKYAQNFYDLFRIDHVVGIFRIWSIPIEEPEENAGLNGFFDPQDENVWEYQGRKILSLIVESTSMLACAEDLGTIPKCSYKVLKELGIPGIEVLRCNKDWQNTYCFKRPSEYRSLAIATISTHDSSNLEAWWRYEAGTVDEELFKRYLKEKNIDFDAVKDKLFDLSLSFYKRLRWKKEISSPKKLLEILKLDEKEAPHIIALYHESYLEKEKFLKAIGLEGSIKEEPDDLFFKRTLEYITDTASIFCINLLFDWLSFSKIFQDNPWMRRINFPGTVSELNWNYIMPISLEGLLDLEINREIREINIRTNRL
ncbi:MAG: 4-alpha-glucanotransferase [Candidatus Omnitrophica bacterium]|nr:4-alpha-glucanotransferase [Candidatus Omnitrophota bacterium]